MSSTRKITCGCGCGREGVLAGRDWIRSCYIRWWKAGKPEEGPPQRGLLRADRMEDFAFLRRHGESVKAAGERIGVSLYTARDYERQLRKARRVSGEAS